MRERGCPMRERGTPVRAWHTMEKTCSRTARATSEPIGEREEECVRKKCPFPASLKVQGNSDEVFTKSGLYVYPTKSEPTYFLLPLSLALGTLPLSVCLPLAGSRPLLDSLARSPALS